MSIKQHQGRKYLVPILGVALLFSSQILGEDAQQTTTPIKSLNNILRHISNSKKKQEQRIEPRYQGKIVESTKTKVLPIPKTTTTTVLKSEAKVTKPAPAALNAAPKNIQNSRKKKPQQQISGSKQNVSLNFNDIKTRDLLQVLAQFTGLNFVISDSVKGNMSVHLKNIPWRQALQVILKSQGLGQRNIGGVILIAPLKEITDFEVQELQSKQKVELLKPTSSRIVKLKYAQAKAIAALLTGEKSSFLSSRGTISVDERTNSLLIHDVPKNIATILAQIRRLDYPVKQVLIEARIVSIRKPFDEQFGVRFGLSKPNHLSGTIEGANALAAGTALSAIPIAQRLNFDLPAAALGGASPATVGLALAKLGDSFVDMELSALEREGEIRVISNPRIITSHQHPAYIKTGEEIPYQEATSSGATSINFKEAVLSLKVLPQVTPDKRVILDLTVTNNRKGEVTRLSGGGEAIAIETQEEQSRVLLNNHQTVVLGGVYVRDKRNVSTRVPFLGKLPVVGNFFKHSEYKDERSELLIFITPHIIESPSQIS